MSSNKTVNIYVKYLNPVIHKIVKFQSGDWVDLMAAETVSMKAGEYKLIPLGVAMELPIGYEAHMVPRSSTFKNYGILQTNGMAIFDESYCGDGDQWYFPAYATRDTEIDINDRICQFRIMKHQPNILFHEVEKLDNANRGGLGSTGRK